MGRGPPPTKRTPTVGVERTTNQRRGEESPGSKAKADRKEKETQNSESRKKGRVRQKMPTTKQGGRKKGERACLRKKAKAGTQGKRMKRQRPRQEVSEWRGKGQQKR